MSQVHLSKLQTLVQGKLGSLALTIVQPLAVWNGHFCLTWIEDKKTRILTWSKRLPDPDSRMRTIGTLTMDVSSSKSFNSDKPSSRTNICTYSHSYFTALLKNGEVDFRLNLYIDNWLCNSLTYVIRDDQMSLDEESIWFAGQIDKIRHLTRRGWLKFLCISHRSPFPASYCNLMGDVLGLCVCHAINESVNAYVSSLEQEQPCTSDGDAAWAKKAGKL